MDNPGEIAGHIGTPLTSNATKVLLLGSGELGKQLAQDIQPRLATGDVRGLDASTAGLLRQFRPRF